MQKGLYLTNLYGFMHTEGGIFEARKWFDMLFEIPDLLTKVYKEPKYYLVNVSDFLTKN